MADEHLTPLQIAKDALAHIDWDLTHPSMATDRYRMRRIRSVARTALDEIRALEAADG